MSGVVLPEEQREIDYLYNQCIRIIEAINQDKYFDLLNETDILLRIVGKDFIVSKGFKALNKQVGELLCDDKKIRVFKLLQRVKSDSDTAIEYYDDDRGNDERLFYRPELEKEIILLTKDIRELISKVLSQEGKNDY